MPLVTKWTAEEFANTSLTLCFQVDAMMNSYLKHLEKTFVEKGGIKERMYAAQTGYRQQQDEKMKGIEKEYTHLSSENERLRIENASLSALAAQ